MKHILVVDDEEDLLELLKMILKDQFKISTAINGAIALQKLLSDNSIDLVLSDISMPGLNGTLLLKKIKEINISTPEVIFITGYSDVSPEMAYNDGVTSLLFKPISRNEIIKNIRFAFEYTKFSNNDFNNIKADIKIEDFETSIKDGILHFGRGGFFYQTDTFYNKGDMLSFEIGKGEKIKILGEIVWQRIESMTLPKGIGIKMHYTSNIDALYKLMNEGIPFIPQS